MIAKIELMSDEGLKYWKTYTQMNELIDLLDVKDLSASLYTVLCEMSQDYQKDP